MPIKYNLTKYDMLSTRIKKVSVKRPPLQMSNEERSIMIKAVLIASFSSGHSWQTYRTITAPGSSLNNPEIKKEYSEALTSKWRTITPFDIVEVSTANIQDGTFSEWLLFNVNRDYHEEYKHAWSELKSEFSKDCDVVERRE
jgi:hypothetical protein